MGDDDELDDLLNQAYPERAEKKVGGGGGQEGRRARGVQCPGSIPGHCTNYWVANSKITNLALLLTKKSRRRFKAEGYISQQNTKNGTRNAKGKRRGRAELNLGKDAA